MEGHRDVGLDRDALDLPAGGIDPRGDVAGDDGRPAAVDRIDRRRGGLPRRPGEPRPEDRVNHSAGAGKPLAQPPDHVLCPEALQVGRRIPAQFLPRPEQQHLDLIAHLGQVPRRHQPIARVVPLAADDSHRALGRQRGNRLRHSLPSRLHQLKRRHPHLLDRPAIERSHPSAS